MTYDLVFVEAGTTKVLHQVENIKVDRALKEFANALIYVSKKGGEVEVGVRVHNPQEEAA